MQPVIVMPMHDPAGQLFPHLIEITPLLKTLFARAVVSITPITRQNQGGFLGWLAQDDFFAVCQLQDEGGVGSEFRALYAHAAAVCAPNQVLHLCFIDRTAFALQRAYRAQFVTDIQAVTATDTPRLFQRSPAAWETHPRNYWTLEQMVTTAGQLLFQKSFDFAWCHLALQTHQLQAILPHISQADFSMLAEMVVALKDTLRTKDVDWLAWEDPFLLSCDPQQLKAEREASNAETCKRLGYVIPMLQVLARAEPTGS